MNLEDRISTLVAAKPGLMRNSLLAFLRGTPRVDVIALADDPITVLEIARQRRPQAAVVDADLCEGCLLGLVRQLRSELPDIKCIVLSNSIHQQQMSLDAGASAALLKGFLGDQLRRAVLCNSANS